MNRILFYSENFSGENAQGGTEVATFRIASALKSSGSFEVYHAFRKKGDGNAKSIYQDIIKLKGSATAFKGSLAKFIAENNIEVVVNMTRFYRHRLIYEAIRESESYSEKKDRQDRDEIRLFFMQHFAPGSEFKKPSYKSGLHLLKMNPFNPLYWVRASVYPLLKLPRNMKLRKLYKETYELSEKVILLSEAYKDDFCRIGSFSDKSKFEAIPNIFDVALNQGDFTNDKKEKRVLILSRLDEIQKRLSLALQIWRKIEDDPGLSSWHLDIVGDGHNKDIVEKMIKRLALERVTLHGWQPRAPFLERAKIMMITSEYEGLPLSLIEAQAYGVVPIVFNSFGGLKDIIQEYHNGVIVEKFGDVEGYVRKLTELMYDARYREELRQNALASADKFSSQKIAERWLKILI